TDLCRCSRFADLLTGFGRSKARQFGGALPAASLLANQVPWHRHAGTLTMKKSLAQVSCVTEGIAAGLRPHRQTVGLGFHRDLLDAAGRGIENVNFIVVSSGEPKLFAVDADVSHVRAAATGN